MKKLGLILLLVAFGHIHLTGQYAFQIELSKTSASYFPRAILQNNDSSYIIAGLIDGISTLKGDCFISKYSASGKQLWLRNIPLPDAEFNATIAHGVDSGYLLSATTYSYPIPDADSMKDIIVIKLNNSGNEVWRKILPAYDHYSTVASPDSSYYVLGDAIVADSNKKASGDLVDFILYKLSSTGRIIWTRTFGTNDMDYPYEGKLFCDGQSNVYFGGETDSSATNYLHGLFYKFDKNGNQIYRKFFSESLTDNIIVAPKQIFEYNGKQYYNRENAVYQIDLNTGKETLINRFTALYQISAQGDNITAIISNKLHEERAFQMVRLNDSFQLYWAKNIKARDKVWGGLWSKGVISSLDNGNVYLFQEEDSTFRFKTVIVKTDCNGNYDKWRECTLGDEEVNETTNGIHVYPNPVSRSFKIEYDEVIKSLKLIDASNKVYFCRHYPTREKEKTIDIPDLKKGLYFLVVNGEYGVKVVKE